MKKILLFVTICIFISSCGIYRPTDTRKIPVNANERVKKNMEEGRGFRISGLGKRGGDFMFSSANPLWRASMNKLSFAPLSVVDYGGGIIITDWFSDGDSNEQIKIAVRFLSNEIRSDALSIKVFYKNCSMSTDCKISDRSGELASELSRKILTQAAVYEKQNVGKNEPYIRSDPEKK